MNRWGVHWTPWDGLPSDVTELNRDNPLTLGMSLLLMPASGLGPADLITGLRFSPQGATTLKGSRGGMGWYVATSATDGLQATVASPAYPFTLGVVFVPNSSGALGNSLINFANSGALNSRARAGIRVGTSSVDAYSMSVTGTLASSTSAIASVQNQINVAAGAFASNASRMVALNGVSAAAETTTIAVGTGIDSLAVGSSPGTSRQAGQTGTYLLAVGWSRALTALELARFTADPWQIFAHQLASRLLVHVPSTTRTGRYYYEMIGQSRLGG